MHGLPNLKFIHLLATVVSVDIIHSYSNPVLYYIIIFVTLIRDLGIKNL